MLGVFMHSGFTVTMTSDRDVVALRFPILPTDAYHNALAKRSVDNKCQAEVWMRQSR